MRVIQNSAISRPDREFLVSFSLALAFAGAAIRRTVRVMAASAAQAKRVCRARYPNALRVQVLHGNGAMPRRVAL